MILNSWPSAINLSGNLPPFIITASSTEIISVKLHRGSEVILEEQYDPDADGKIKVDYSKIIDSLLLIEIPPFIPGAFVQTKGKAIFSATLASSNGIDSQTVSFKVIKGGVEGIVNQQIFLESNFLTWQPQVKEVKYHDPEFLSYYASTAVDVKVKAHFAAGDQTITLATLTSNELSTINVNYGNISSAFPNPVLYFDVWIEAPSAIQLTSVQRYIFTDREYENESIILFENSLGGIDTIRLTGQIEEKNTSTISNALFDQYVVEFDVQPERALIINSGYLKNNREVQWAVDLLNSLQKYLIIDGSLTAVYSDKPEISNVKGELAFFEITFLCSKKTRYLNLSRHTNPLPNLTLSTNTGQVFFLAPKLNDLSWANSNDVLIPVQFPYENFFRKLSLASIISGSGAGIANELDPTVPAHVKSITQGQITKWDNAAISSDYYTKLEIGSILSGSPSLLGYNKLNWDNVAANAVYNNLTYADPAFISSLSYGKIIGAPTKLSDLTNDLNLNLTYHPLENQRLSKSNNVEFAAADIASALSIPTTAPSNPAPGKVYLYASGFGGGGGTPPTAGYFVGLQDVDPSALADQYVPYYDAASGKFKFRANNFGSVSWTSISGRPTNLSQFTNDLGNYGNWITKAQADSYYPTLSGYNKSNWDAAFVWGNHAGLYQPIENQRLSTADNVAFNSVYADMLEGNNIVGNDFYSYGEIRADAGLRSLNNGVYINSITGYSVNIVSPSLTGDRTVSLPNTSGQLALVSQIPTNVVYNDGGTYNINISGSAAKWNGTPFTAGNIPDTPYFITLNGSATNAGYSSLGQVSASLGVNNGSTLNNNISGSASKWGNQFWAEINNPTFASIITNNGSGWGYSSVEQFRATLGLPSTGAYDLQWITSNGNTTTTGARFGGKLTWGAGFGETNIGEIYNDAVLGTVLIPKFGSSYDFSLTSGNGSSILQIPTGTLNAIFNGNVGVGTSSPGAKLDVNGSIYSNGNILANTFGGYSGGNVVLTTNTSGVASLLFKTALSDRMIINSDGNVGIGTTAPSFKLDVSGDGRFSGINYNSGVFISSGNLSFYNASSMKYISAVDDASSANAIGILKTGGTVNISIPNGNINVAGQVISTGRVLANKLSGDGSDWTNAHLEIQGTNPGIGFHYPGTYAAPLWMGSNGVLQWNGAGFFTNNYVESGRIVAGYDSGVVGSVNASAWFRSIGNSGWYNTSYGGGIYMYDSTWVRTFNQKGFYVDGSTGITADAAIVSNTKLKAPAVEATAELIIPRSAPVAPVSGNSYLYSI